MASVPGVRKGHPEPRAGVRPRQNQWNNHVRYGFPQELQHFVHCVRGKETPRETGEDGREVLKIIYAAYESAGTGKRIDWPYAPRKVDKPIDLWHGVQTK